MADLMPTPTSEKALSRGLLDVLIRAGLVAVLAIACYQILRPFLNLILWSMILAVTLYPLQGRLKGMVRPGAGSRPPSSSFAFHTSFRITIAHPFARSAADAPPLKKR